MTVPDRCRVCGARLAGRALKLHEDRHAAKWLIANPHLPEVERRRLARRALTRKRARGRGR